MSQKILASNELKKFMNMFKSLIAVAEDLEKLGGIEQVLQEKEKSLKSFDDVKESLKAQIDEMNQKVLSLTDVVAANELVVAKDLKEKQEKSLISFNATMAEKESEKAHLDESIKVLKEESFNLAKQVSDLSSGIKEKEAALEAVVKKLNEIKGSI